MKNNDIGFYIRKLNNHIEKYSHSLYSRKDTNECSLSNLWVIDYVSENSDIDIYQKDVEAEFSINRATASKMLSLMEEKKFISRISSSEDGRKKKIKILPEGEKLRGICASLKKEMEQELTSPLSKEEIEILRNLLRKMIKHFED
ncbi:winged helix-turn-helix transcriptional regulator [Fusobacterium perfoetens]|uniref:MarR family winged helix-turn-helix transcriptional regulator n=1 Tax=Fusobacterium perfoetens TaxID=852 RepID=UPI001F199CD4|nr:MarR family winged helix-turn-helix transcriptional regulator [Fusobacterium perfoetens]MCF2626291.1 winged helix-turn-helix transcriptional regulator [Fusobacterium perfoetens]